MAKTFTSSNGRTVTIRPVSQFKIDTIRGSKKEISVPTYSVTNVAGDVQEFPLDEEIAKSQGREAEWAEYKKANAKNEAAFAKKYFSLLIWDGTDVEISPEWEEECAFFGTLPENRIEKKVQYVYDQILMTPEDMNDLMAEILLVSQISKEVVDNLRTTFRSRIQRNAHRQVPEKEESLEGGGADLGDAGNSEILESEAV
jgi:hypothetical protein